MEIKLQNSIYEGLADTDLIYLFQKLPINISIQQQESLFIELLHRYLEQGRKFNIYELIYKEMRWFMFTIGVELSTNLVNIPVDHIEYFVRGLLNFIELLEQHKDKIARWEIHELAGLQSMLETLKQARIKDLVFIQRVNLLIERINKEREKAVEEASPTAIIAQPEHHQLMQQQLKKFTIAVSKVNKDDLLDALRHLSLYSEKDKQKILSSIIRRYEYDAFDTKTNTCLKWVIDNKYETKHHLHSYIYKAASRVSLRSHEAYQKFELWLKNWYMSCPNATDHNYDLFIRSVRHSISRNLVTEEYKQDINKKVEQFLPIMKKYQGKTLSEILDAHINIGVGKTIHHYHAPEFAWNGNGWSITQKPQTTRQCSIFEYWCMLYSEHPTNIEELEKFPSTIIIDDISDNKTAIEITKSNWTENHLQNIFRVWMLVKQKYGFTIQELNIIYGNKQRYLGMYPILDTGFMSYEKYFNQRITKDLLPEILKLYDLQYEADRQVLFAILNKEGVREYGNNNISLIYDKIIQEYPHETKLIISICESVEVKDIVVEEEGSIIEKLLGLLKSYTVENATLLYNRPVPKEEAIKIATLTYFCNKYKD